MGKISEGTESIWLSAFVLAGMLSILAYAGHNFSVISRSAAPPFIYCNGAGGKRCA